MPRGVASPPGPSLYPECGTPGRAGTDRHRREGTPSCQPCRNSAAASARRYRSLRRRLGHRRIDATGTRRRLRALAALGWPMRDLSVELGWEPTRAQKLTAAGHVWADTAADVRLLYDRLSMTPGPSLKTRRRAEAAGWLPPLAWDDDCLDDPGYVPAEQVLRDWEEALALHRRWLAAGRKREQRAAAAAALVRLPDRARPRQRARESAA